MLYLMHIDWNWIKQRPQYIEEELEKNFNITVVCPRNYRLKEYNDKQNVKVFYTIPFIRRYPGVWRIDDLRREKLVHNLIKTVKPDFIYCTSPEYSRAIPDNYKGKVIYDCMDDMLSFNAQSHMVRRVASQERKMMSEADIVFATSERLRKILCKRYPEKKQSIYLIRNGYDGKIADVKKPLPHELYTLCYFGTISHWFNFEYMEKSLDEFPDIQYLLIGPIEGGTEIPENKRIKYLPPVKHEALPEATKEADAFIMPFQLNQLILSVDPVKLYEYINFGKDILCVEYPEIERFRDFVYFYKDYNSFAEQIENMQSNSTRKYDEKKRIEFLKNNSWEQRASTIVSAIFKLDNNN